MSTPPPRLARWLLAKALPRADRRFALADIEDEFERRCGSHGLATARAWYRQQVRRSLVPALRRRITDTRRAATADLADDLRFGLRSLAKTPIVGMVTVLSLGVGIAASTAVFTAANSFLLRPTSLQVVDPDRLVGIFTVEADGSRYEQTAFSDFEEITGHTDALAQLAAVRMGSVSYDEGAARERLLVEIVSGNYFDLLGLRPALGRGFLPDETRLGAAQRVAIISHGMWQRRFGGAADIVGETIKLDGDPFTIVGVAPSDMVARMLALEVDAWLPIGIPGGVYRSDEEELADRLRREYTVVGRLADGAALEQAQAQLDVLSKRLHDTWGADWEDDRGQRLSLVALPDREARTPPDMRLALRGLTALVLFAALLILLVACFNVAGIFLARASTRSREMAVRLALGASRLRVVRMLLTESLVLGVASGALGVLLSTWMVSLFDSVPLPIGDINLRFAFALDTRVLLFTAGLSVATSMLFGLAPALESSRPSLVPSLRGEQALGGGGHRRLSLRNALVVGQAAVAVIFVVGAGTAWSSFVDLTEVDWGVTPDRIAMMSRPLPEEIAGDAVVPWFEETLSSLSAQPGVQQAALASAAEGSAMALLTQAQLEIPEYERADDESMVVPFKESLETRAIKGSKGSAHPTSGCRCTSTRYNASSRS